MIFTAAHLVAKLRHLQRTLDASILPVIRVRVDDRHFAWPSLPAPHCTMRGIDVGQTKDLRFATDGNEGLHAHVFRSRGVVEFHLDAVNACGDAAGHAVADTEALGGTLVGAAFGLLLGSIARHPGIGLALGTIAGGALGASIPKRRRQVFQFEDLFPASRYRQQRFA
jgi:hypothetical protein